MGPGKAHTLAQIVLRQGIQTEGDQKVLGYSELGSHPERSLHAWTAREIKYEYKKSLLSPYWIFIPLYEDVSSQVDLHCMHNYC